MTFGKAISDARKEKGLSQKELAAIIIKDDGVAISPQYLNDIERDRRNAPPTYLIDQFAKVLEVPLEYLYYLANELPNDVKSKNLNQDQVVAAWRAFRQSLKE